MPWTAPWPRTDAGQSSAPDVVLTDIYKPIAEMSILRLAISRTSPSTIEKHRNSIRRKLGILNKKANFETYLKSLA